MAQRKPFIHKRSPLLFLSIMFKRVGSQMIKNVVLWRKFATALSVASALLLGQNNAFGAATITIQQTAGPNVVATISGSLNTTALSGPFITSYVTGIQASTAFLNTGGSLKEYTGISGPTSMGTGSTASGYDLISGQRFGMQGSAGGRLLVPSGYVSGAPIAGSFTVQGQTISSLGLTPGTYTYTWGTSPNNDALSVIVSAPTDTTPPVTTGPTVSSVPTQTTAGISVAINEAGTGYWLRLPAASPAPSAATVEGTGTSLAMSANLQATINLSGLTANTAYKLYFVAKDATNNLQTATSSVTFTTATLVSQSITGFSPASPVLLGVTPVTLSATGGDSANPIVFATTSAASVCTVSGNAVTFTGVGVCNLTANQAGDSNYAAAPEVTASITVNSSSTRSVSGTSPKGGTVTASFSGGSENCAYASTGFTTPTLPPGVYPPHGAFGFTTNDCGADAVLNVTITYPQALPAGTQVYKFGPTTANPNNHWHVLNNPSVSIIGNRITFTITDNDINSGDSNPADGFITDPVAAGAPVDASGVASVPTLSEWGLLLLGGLMALLGMRQSSQGRRQR